MLIKKIEKVIPMKSGGTAEKPWTLFLFECLVDVDGSGHEAVRMVKTFDSELAKELEAGAGKIFEAKQQGDAAPFSYLVSPEKKGKGSGFKPQSAGESYRQTALRSAIELEKLCSGVVGFEPTIAEVLAAASLMLAWLEGGAK